MRENKYDDPDFFEKYGQMPRSAEGLSAAGEWRQFREMFPELAGKRVLDLGCGYGWHCKYAADNGAASVLGIDISEKMLEEAKRRNADPVVEYRRLAIEDAALPDGSFDLAVSSLALHYVESFAGVAANVHHLLAGGGAFVFSVEHPVFTAEGRQEWFCDAEGNRVFWPVDRYFDESVRNAVFLGKTVKKYHRTVASYLAGLLENGFVIRSVVEPTPERALMESVPEMRDELRRPMMMLVAAEKR